MKKIIVAAFLLLLNVGIFAEVHNPVGRWITYDDETGKAKSIVTIRIEEGTLFGKIDSLYIEHGDDPDPICDECKGKNKDKQILGMTMLWDMKLKSDTWKSGKILDPENGKIYDCKINVIDGGEKLEVRGFLGISLLGRTQHWIRVE